MSETLMVYNCPFCVDRKGTPDTKGHFYWYGPENGYFCFRCGAVRGKGPLPAELEDVTVLAQPREEPEVRAPGDWVQEKPGWFIRNARPAWKYLTARSYLEKRGIDERTAKASRLLYATSGHYAQRIIFPVFDYRIMENPGERPVHPATVYFVARTVVSAEPKYLNCPTGKNGWVYLVAGKGDKFPLDTVLVVEGVFDAYAASRTGIPTVALLGKRINSGQARYIAAIAKHAVVVLDSDAFASGIEVSHKLSYYLPTTRAELPPRMDPDKLVMNHGPAALNSIVSYAMRNLDEQTEEED